MKILVVNCGSSSLRFQVVEIKQIEADEKLLAKGLVERIGKPDAAFHCTTAAGDRCRLQKPIRDYKAAIETAFGFLRDKGVVHKSDIEGVGHRVVLGGEHFRESVRINADVENAIEACSDLAPLHNPHNLAGYRAVRDLFPSIPQVAVFDTAFHSTIPPKAHLYAIPYEFYEKDKLRRYGFHGTSHRFISQRFAQIHPTSGSTLKLITCHLGNGCSLCAVDGGRSVDTSMGFTPLEGLMMGTRCGDIDPGIQLHFRIHGRYTDREIESILNQKSGLLGISGISNDMRDLIQKRGAGDERASLAVEMFCYRARKYIGAYIAALGGADAVIFAGGIGENSPEIRAGICGGLEHLGIVLDEGRNRSTVGIEAEISADASRIQAWVIPTNEELLIARDTVRCILGLPFV